MMLKYWVCVCVCVCVWGGDGGILEEILVEYWRDSGILGGDDVGILEKDHGGILR